MTTAVQDMTDEQKKLLRQDFSGAVNMSPNELEDWLATDESTSVGDSDTRESTGHRSGRRIIDINRTNADDLTDDDYRHMRKVVNYIKRHTAQPPSGDPTDTPWRYSLMNWGHDPLKN